ncbi:MAG TPA: hypothetical protein VI524_05990 [Anaerolineales bacterium]|nr:hypothetical protein [Anaerolineales bacterium]
MADFITKRYSRQGLWSLFLVCAFPLHLWTLILAFRDISWLTERTNAWDAVGVASYGMVFALIESVVVFLVVALLGFLTPRRWQSDQRVAFLGLLILLTSLWGMIGQLLFLSNVWLPAPAVQFLRESGHPLRIMYAAALAVVVPTVVLPIYSFIRWQKAVAFMQNLMERLSVLTMFYLVFDLLGLIIIIIRNM